LLENNKNKIVPMVLIGNKSDLRDSSPEAISYEAGLEYAKNLSEWSNFEIPYVETSALSGDNVDAAFATLLRNIESNLSS
jgi:GTPase SAR1 family protein